MSDDNDDFFENFSTAPQDIAINPANVHYTNFLDDDNNTASALIPLYFQTAFLREGRFVYVLLPFLAATIAIRTSLIFRCALLPWTPW